MLLYYVNLFRFCLKVRVTPTYKKHHLMFQILLQTLSRFWGTIKQPKNLLIVEIACDDKFMDDKLWLTYMHHNWTLVFHTEISFIV